LACFSQLKLAHLTRLKPIWQTSSVLGRYIRVAKAKLAFKYANIVDSQVLARDVRILWQGKLSSIMKASLDAVGQRAERVIA
jgi:hypothetical protein